MQLERTEKTKRTLHIYAVIWVEKPSQKKIVLGEKGQKIKELGIAARQSLESFLDRKICLKLWVKVKENWSDNMVSLKNFGYIDAET